MSENIPRVKKGTIVTCARCDAEIAEVIEDLYSGQLIRASSLRGISQEINERELMACKKCGYHYFWGGRLHTKDGWI